MTLSEPNIIAFEPKRQSILRSAVSLLVVIDTLISTFASTSENREEFTKGVAPLREKIKQVRFLDIDSKDVFPLVVSSLSGSIPVLKRISIELATRNQRLQKMTQHCCSLIGEVNASVDSIRFFLKIPSEKCQVIPIDIVEKGE